MLSKLYEKFLSTVFFRYIDLVYKTSKLIKTGVPELLIDDNKEKMVVLFWHGDSYCFYPFLKGRKLNVVTTKNRRGDFITSMCKRFGYDTIRVPDNPEKGKYLFEIRRKINQETEANLAIALDGPLGPYHKPKDFAFITALFANRKVLPVSIRVENKIELKKRWDKFKIPLPFNKISIKVNDPIEIKREERKENFATIKNKVKTIMEEDF